MDGDDSDRASSAKRGSPFLSPSRPPPYLGASSRSLKRLRVLGQGRVFRRHCRFVQYHIDDLDG